MDFETFRSTFKSKSIEKVLNYSIKNCMATIENEYEMVEDPNMFPYEK